MAHGLCCVCVRVFVRPRPRACPDITGTVLNLTSGAEMVMPGDNTTLSIELIEPVAMHTGMRFAIREGGRTVGAGVVSKVLE